MHTYVYRVSFFHIHVQKPSCSKLLQTSHFSRDVSRPTLLATFERRKHAIEDERFNKTARSKSHKTFLNTGILPGEWLGINGSQGSSFVLTRRLSANERFDGPPRKRHKGNEISKNILEESRYVVVPRRINFPSFFATLFDPLTRYKLIYSRKDGINAAGRTSYLVVL